MSQPFSVLTADAVTALLHTKTLGKTLTVYSALASTNDTAKAVAADAAHGTVIIADHQSAGRGRRGRSFFSPRGCGVYMSVILKENLSADKVGLLTTAAAVAVARAIENLVPAQVYIKWVNDLLINGKKVCGILTEGTPNGNGGYDFAVIGIGVNVCTADFPPEIDAIATSLLRECGEAPERAVLIAAILRELETVLSEMDTGAFLEESRRRSAVLGKAVTVIRGNETFAATAVAIDHAGALVVETDTGIKTLSSGEVSLRL